MSDFYSLAVELAFLFRDHVSSAKASMDIPLIGGRYTFLIRTNIRQKISHQSIKSIHKSIQTFTGLSSGNRTGAFKRVLKIRPLCTDIFCNARFFFYLVQKGFHRQNCHMWNSHGDHFMRFFLMLFSMCEFQINSSSR